MEYLIRVYRRFGDRIRLIAEIRWSGEFNRDPTRFAHEHGGDLIEVIDTYDDLY